MKQRSGFVSNSSSSSFVISKKALKKGQLKKIRNHMHKGTVMGLYTSWNSNIDDSWLITKEFGMVKGTTMMANFPMREFLEKIGVNMDAVTWGDL